MSLTNDAKFNEEVNFARLFSDVADSFDVTAKQITRAANAVRDELKQRPWQKSFNYQGINYNDTAKCCGYLKRYAACHCALTRYSTQETFRHIPAYVCKLLSRNLLRVVSVGGGPGNDLVGFCSAIFRKRWDCLETLDITVIDLKNGWEEIFEEVISAISESSYGYVTGVFNDVDVLSEFIAADLTSSPTPSVIRSADIILMTKVLSVVSNAQKDKILQGIFSSMKEGAIFLFTDIESSIVLRNSSFFGMTVLYQSSQRQFFVYEGASRSSISRSSYEICAVQKSGPCGRVRPDVRKSGFHPITVASDEFGFENEEDYENDHGDVDYDDFADEGEDDGDYGDSDYSDFDEEGENGSEYDVDDYGEGEDYGGYDDCEYNDLDEEGENDSEYEVGDYGEGEDDGDYDDCDYNDLDEEGENGIESDVGDYDNADGDCDYNDFGYEAEGTVVFQEEGYVYNLVNGSDDVYDYYDDEEAEDDGAYDNGDDDCYYYDFDYEAEGTVVPQDEDYLYNFVNYTDDIYDDGYYIDDDGGVCDDDYYDGDDYDVYDYYGDDIYDYY